MLKYKYNFLIKYTEKIFYQTAVGNLLFEIIKMLIAVKK